ncbi:MAG: LapA family protein [Clostridia bacterium]|nr:LapA family protein [Clostridia bacterium]
MLLSLASIAAVTVFAVQNSAAVPIRFAVWEAWVSLAWLVTGALLLGVVATALPAWWHGARLRRALRIQEARVRELEGASDRAERASDEGGAASARAPAAASAASGEGSGDGRPVHGRKTDKSGEPTPLR